MPGLSFRPSVLSVNISFNALLAATFVCSALGAVEVSTSEAFVTAVESALPGDVIEIQAGSYTGVCSIIIRKSLTITGIGQVHLDCGGQASHLSVAGNETRVALNNLAFVRGLSRLDGGCISVSSGANLGANRCSFSECMADGRGGAIFVQDSATVLLHQATFSQCHANRGGAIGVQGPTSSVSMEGCRLINNSAAEDGGGVFLESASISIQDDSTFQGNVAQRGGGIAAMPTFNSTHSCSISIERNAVFQGNVAEVLGGGIYFLGSGSLVSSDVAFVGNIASSSLSSAGGALYIDGPVAALITGASAITNCSARRGGALWIGGGCHLEVRAGPVISHNMASLDGGALYGVGGETLLHFEDRVRIEYNMAQWGGAIILVQGPSLNFFHDIDLSNNQGTSGGGALIYFLNTVKTLGQVRIHNNHAARDGGGIHHIVSVVSNYTEGTSFRGNTCGRQGGAVSTNRFTTFVADKVEFTDNAVISTAGAGGGGISCQDCTMHLSHCLFARNAAPTSAAISWKGGGSCRSSVFEHNTGDEGGGVSLFSEAPVTLDRNIFFNNSARRNGGCLLSTDASVVHLSNSNFSKCNAGKNGGAVAVKGSGALHLSGIVTIEQSTASGVGGGVHHEGLLFHIQSASSVEVVQNSAGGGGGVSSTAETVVDGYLLVSGNMANDGDGGGVQGAGSRSIFSVSGFGRLEVEDNEAKRANGGGLALLDNARIALAISTCPVGCNNLGDGTCSSVCMSPECAWDAGDCAYIFLEAKESAEKVCSRENDGCPFWSLSSEAGASCARGCLSTSCEWGFGGVACNPAVEAIGTCPYLLAMVYEAVTATDVVYIAEGGTAGGYGRCESDTCLPADPSIGRDEPYCTSINDGGNVWALDCPDCATGHDTGVEAWGPCAPKDKPRLPHVGFDYNPDELRAISTMDIPSVLRAYPGCGYSPLAVRRNRAALAGGGVYKDRCDPFLEGADRCFLGELDNSRLQTILVDVSDNSAGGPGGGIFVECGEMRACLSTMAKPVGLPITGNGTQRLMHFGEHSTAEAYGIEVAGLPSSLEITSPPRNYTPGQSHLDSRFSLRDPLGQLLHGSELWANPHVVEISVCRVGVHCRAADALQPPILLRSHATDHETSLLRATELLERCPVHDHRVEVHVRLTGQGDASLHKSMVAGCDPCGVGQEMVLHDDDQMWSCRSCQPTEYVTTPLGGCQPCPLEGASCDGRSLQPEVDGSEWSAEDGVMRVQSCPAGYILVRNPAVPVLDACVACPPGKYSIQRAQYPHTLVVRHAADAPQLCSECLRGADCLGGSDIVSLPGFWADHSMVEGEGSDVVLYQCSPRACEGNNSCSEGRHGAVCGRCDEEWSKSGLECVLCGEESALGQAKHVPSFVVTVLAAGLLVYLLTWRPLLEDYERAVTARLWCSSSEREESEESAASTSRLRMIRRHIAHIQWTSPAMIGAFKVAVSFYQVASTFNVTFRIEWPESFNFIFNLGRLTGLDLTLLLPSVACISQPYSHLERLLIFTAGFPILVTLLLCLPLLITRLLGVLRHGGSTAHPKYDKVQRSCLRAVLMWFFLIYPTVSEQTLASFLCQDIGSGGHVLVMDTRAECPWAGSSPSEAFYLSLALVLVFPVGIQAFFYYVISSFFVPAMAAAKYRRALFSELVKLYRRETSTAVTMKLAHHFGIVCTDKDSLSPLASSALASTPIAASPPRAVPTGQRNQLPRPPQEDESEAAVPMRSFKRRVSQLFTQSFVQRELSGTMPEPAVHDKLRHVLEQFGCSEEELVRVTTVLQRLSITTSYSEELEGFEQLALRIAHNHFLFCGHETLDDLSMEQLRALFLFDWEGLNRKRSEREIRKRKARRQHLMSGMDRDKLREWVFSRATELEKASRITVPNLNWNGESTEEHRALGFVGFLFDDFRVQTWWFFLLGEFCKLIMTSVLVFIPGRFWQQLAWGFFVQVCITAMYAVYRPMAEQWLNDFQVYALCLQSALLFFGLLLAVSDDQSPFAPWADFLVALKWSLPFFPLVVMLLGKTARAVQFHVKQLVQGPTTDTEDRDPSCLERVLFPTATNSKARLRRQSSEMSAGGLSQHRSASDAELLVSELRHASSPASHTFHSGNAVNAQLGALSPRCEESGDAAEFAACAQTEPPSQASDSSPAEGASPMQFLSPTPSTPAESTLDRLGPSPHHDTRDPVLELELSVVPTPRK